MTTQDANVDTYHFQFRISALGHRVSARSDDA